MQSTFMSTAVVALFDIAPLFSVEVLSHGAAALGERQGGRAVAVEKKTSLAHVETKRMRYAAYYEDARERCTVDSGRAREICIGEARLKYLQ